MDQQDESLSSKKSDTRIDDRDLPDPVQPVLKEEELAVRKDRLFAVLFTVACFYSLVHKLFIPAFLTITNVSLPEYKAIDLWFVPVTLVLWLFWKQPRPTLVKAALAGVLVAHAAVAAYLISRGEVKGWLVFSQMLSNIPVAALLIVWLSRNAAQNFILTAWGAALVYSALHAFVISNAGFSPAKIINPSIEVAEARNEDAPISQISQSEEGEAYQIWKTCGLTSLRVNEELFQRLPVQSWVEVRDCGFFPAAFKLGSAPLLLVNRSAKRLNLHIFVRGPKGQKQNLNRVVAPSEKIELSSFKMEEGSSAYIYSDAHPDLGASVMMNSLGSGDVWDYSRLPLRVELNR